MSVHDVGNYRTRKLVPGIVFSIEPMIWVLEEMLYIRMEDVLVVTENAVEALSDCLPVDMDDIERLMDASGVIRKRR